MENLWKICYTCRALVSPFSAGLLADIHSQAGCSIWAIPLPEFLLVPRYGWVDCSNDLVLLNSHGRLRRLVPREKTIVWLIPNSPACNVQNQKMNPGWFGMNPQWIQTGASWSSQISIQCFGYICLPVKRVTTCCSCLKPVPSSSHTFPQERAT